MRRALTIAACVAMMLAAGEPVMVQAQTLQVQQIKPKFQPKIQPRIQNPNRPPNNMVLIKPSQALIIAQRLVPNSKGINVQLLPGGNYAVTLKRKNEVRRLIIDGETGEPR
jgi:hypothetical protein